MTGKPEPVVFFLLLPVMDILESRYYRINAITLMLVGLWPYEERKRQRIQQVLFHFSVMSVMMTQGIKLVELWGNLDAMIECITPMGVQVNACIKSLNCIINRDKMKNLFDAIKRDWANLRRDDEIKILKEYAEQGRKLSVLYTGYITCTGIIYLSIPLMPQFLDVILPLNESRQRTHLYRTEYFVDPDEYYYPIMVHTYAGTIITVSVVFAADAIFATFVQHVCGILAVVGHRLENLMKLQDVNADPLRNDDICYEELVRCIDEHSRALEFGMLIEDAYSTAFLLQVLVSMVLLSMSAVQLLINFGEGDETIRLIQFNLAQFLHILFNSWPGQKLLDQSVSFRDSVYFAEWYSISMRGKVLLKFVLMRTLVPLKLTAGRLYDLSLENFGVVIRASASYFTVFASLR